ncbi:phosphoribosylformylglycinamidine synthase subunit PurS [Brumimicrobium sp.]|uniref:phosphoribosylformylglycinamidine synthase subunit PurS n=1 Tax=Brumimicrobium sp. TaxID=2029867 RepID=UPI003A9244AA
MKFKVEIDIMLKSDQSDSQADALTNSMKSIGFPEIINARVGRHVQFYIEAEDQTQASQKVEEACKKTLVHPDAEEFTFSITEV